MQLTLSSIMQKVYCFITLLFMLSCASFESKYIIEGKLKGKTYDGEFIYLVPVEGATAETVDSVQIKDGAFRFEGDASVPSICILRTRPLLRMELQELLVVTEPGTISVILDTESSAKGTPQNEALQLWKEQKRNSDFAYTNINQQLLEADESKKEELKKLQMKYDKEYSNFNYNFVKQYKHTAVGEFVYKMTGFSFTPEQKKEINSL